MSDLIRREDAIKAIEELPNAYNGWSDAYDKAYIIGTLEEIPSADRPQGEWIDRGMRVPCSWVKKCSLCGHETDTWRWCNFCPNCGARMFAKDTNVPNKKGADDE